MVIWKKGGNKWYFGTMVDDWQTQNIFWVAAGQKTGCPGSWLLAIDTYILVTESNNLLSLDV